MFGKTELKPNKLRDGRHCDLCGCSFPAVRCDKCSSQIFCLSCDDMYHRHPKRRFHLRKAVDPTPTPQARPVLPMKVSTLTLAPGDPSKMPLPPPRKKKSGKSIFDSFRRGSPASDTSPTTHKKEYSWTGKLGNITKFMSNRPLPPVPDSATDNDENTSPEANFPSNHNLSFIHRKVDEKPPALPQRQPRTQPQTQFAGHDNAENNATRADVITNGNGPHIPGPMSHGADQNWFTNQQLLKQAAMQPFGTIRRQSQPLDPSKDNKSSGMNHSSSASDLTMLSDVSAGPTMQPYPPYPYNPHITPPYPYPMYPPQYPPYPQYFGNSWANLASPPHSTDPDFSDHSESASRRYNRGRHKSHMEKKAKRSQSVLVDRMGYPGQFYPFGPFPPGYPPHPWMGNHPTDAPPSPSVSLRSLSRLSHSHRRRKVTDDDDDDFSSSPLSRPKSSSSELSKNRLRARTKSCPSSSSSEDEGANKVYSKAKASPLTERKHMKQQKFKRKNSGPNVPSPVHKSDNEAFEHSKMPASKQIHPHRENNLGSTSAVEKLAQLSLKDNEPKSVIKKKSQTLTQEVSSASWQCKHCTYINSSENHICQVCCKTAHKSVSPVDQEEEKVLDRNESADSAKSAGSPSEVQTQQMNDDADSSEKHDIAVLNSAIDEAEKQINESLEELLRVKEESSQEKAAKTKKKKKGLVDQSSSTNNMDVSDDSRGIVRNELSNVATSQASGLPLSTLGSETNANNNASAPYHMAEQVKSASVSSPKALTEIKTDSGTQKDSFCQTYQDIEEVMQENVGLPLSSTAITGNGEQQHIHRSEYAQSPMSFNPYQDQRFANGYNGMQRAHSRASLFGGRQSDAVPPSAFEYGNFSAGFGPSSLCRSLSRASLLGEADGWGPSFQPRPKPDFYLSMEELVERRRQDTMRAQGLELVRMIREAEQKGFTADDIQVALNNCGKQNPVTWLQENWRNIIRTVVTLATNYGKDKQDNDVGTVSENEARDALRFHKGNIWAAVTECVEGRQRKFLELSARGNFTTKEIVDALTTSEGDVELAYAKLTNTTLKPFLMRIWGSGEGVPNLEGVSFQHDMPRREHYLQDKIASSGTSGADENEANAWDEYGDDLEWDGDSLNEESDAQEEDHDMSAGLSSQEIASFKSDDLEKSEKYHTLTRDTILSPESDKSDYCDAFGPGLGDRYLSSTSIDEIYLIDEDIELEPNPSFDEGDSKKKSSGFLSKLVGFRKEKKSTKVKKPDNEELINEENNASPRNEEVFTAPEEEPRESSDKDGTAHNFHPLNILRNTFTALKDTVTGTGTKAEKKISPSMFDRRTIVVHDTMANEMVKEGSTEDVVTNLTSKESSLIKSNSLTHKTTEEGIESHDKTEQLKSLIKPDVSLENKNVRNEIGSTKIDDPVSNLNSLNKEAGGLHCDSTVGTLTSIQEIPYFDEVVETKSEVVHEDYSKPYTENDLNTSVSDSVVYKENLNNSTMNQDVLISEGSVNSFEYEGAENIAHFSEAAHTLTNNLSGLVEMMYEAVDEMETLHDEGKSVVEQAVSQDVLTSVSVAVQDENHLAKSEITEKYSIDTDHGADIVTSMAKSKEILSKNSLSDNLESGSVTGSPSTPFVEDESTHINTRSTGKKVELEKCENTNVSDGTSTISDDAIMPEIKTAEISESSDVSKAEINTTVTSEISKAPAVDLNGKGNKSVKTKLKRKGSAAKERKEKNEPQEVKLLVGNHDAHAPTESKQLTHESSSHHDVSKDTEPMFLNEEKQCSEVVSKDTEPMFLNEEKQCSEVISKDTEPMFLNEAKQYSEVVRNDTAANNEGGLLQVNLNEPFLKSEDGDQVNVIPDKFVELNAENNIQEIKELREDDSGMVDNGSGLHINEKYLANATQENEIAAASSRINQNEVHKFSKIPSTTEIGEIVSITNRVEDPGLSHTVDTNTVQVVNGQIEAKNIPDVDRSSQMLPTNNIEEAKNQDLISIQISADGNTTSNSVESNKKSVEDASSSTISPDQLEGIEKGHVQQFVSRNDLKDNDASNSANLSSAAVETSVLPGSSMLVDKKDQLVKTTGKKPAIDTKELENKVVVNKQLDSRKDVNLTSCSVGGEGEIKVVQNAASSVDIATTTASIVHTATLVKDDTIAIGSNVKPSTSVDIVANDQPVLTFTPTPSSERDGAKLTHNDAQIEATQSEAQIEMQLEIQTDATRSKEGKNTISLEPPQKSTTTVAPENSQVATQNVTEIKGGGEPDIQDLQRGSSTDSQDVDGEEEADTDVQSASPIRPAGHLRRMSFNTRREAIFRERNRDSLIIEQKPWFTEKKVESFKPTLPKRSIRQQLEFERKVRKLVSDRKCRTYRKAEIVAQLLELKFEETEAIYAANECSNLEQALSFLQQECQLCAGKYPVGEIVSMVHCSHKACKECIKAYFTIQIRDRTIMELQCPFCNEPDITDEDIAQDYFNHLDIMLKKLVDHEIHELFQRKLRDRVLMKDPNFRWCSQCSSGFIADPYLKRLICPDCNAITCASCRRLWEREHEGVSCEAFALWKDTNDPEAQTTGLAKLLTEDGIDCPSCHFRYALAKGGCMHFKCIQCQHDFCSGCCRPFKMGKKCGLSEFCAKLGLHAHHPRNCLFYLRDKEPGDLERLLDLNSIDYDKDSPCHSELKTQCEVMEQKETSHGMVDDICGKEVQEGYAGLCRVHYVEYLGQLVNKYRIDPIQIFDNDDLELVLKRASIRLPPKKYRESSEEYRDKLVQLIEEKLPLGQYEGS